MEVCMKRNTQRGQALVFVAVGLVALLGFIGLGIDVGTLRYQKRLQQTAADAAAVAGASNLGFSGIQTGAQNASALNGFTDNSGSACAAPSTNLALGTTAVIVCNPPITGPHTGDAKYVEAYVSVGQPTYFSKIFGVNSETITARAVATNFSGAGGSTSGDKTGCLYTLGSPSSSIEGVAINGSSILNAPTCGILDNGDYNSKGNKLIVNADTFGVGGTGNISGPGGSVTCTAGTSACPSYGVPATSDPMGSVSPPCSSPCSPGTSISIDGNGNFSGSGASNVTYNSATQTYTIQPGTYSGINIQGTGGGNNVVFAPGTYIIDGTSGCNASCVSIPGNATISGNGVTFYFTNSSTIQMNGNPIINLTAPSSGTYADILMWQDKNDTNVGPNPNGPTLGGNSGSTYDGILYFPSDQLTFYGNNNSISVGVVIFDSMALSGNPTVNFTGTPGLPGPLPPGTTFGVGRAFLVE
jgi:putative Flp pilus-assembly TadE/G-like protein